MNSLTKNFKLLLLFCLTLTFGSNIVAQVKVGASNSAEWKIFHKDSSVQIDYRFDNCNLKYDGINKDEVYLKIQNLTDEKLEINWELVLNYSNKCYNCNRENDELKFTTILEPYQILEGKCEEYNVFQLKIFSKFLNNESETKLKDFNIKYITTKTSTK